MPKTKLELRQPRDKDEAKQLIDVSFQSFAGFGFGIERTEMWLSHIGQRGQRICLVGDEVVGGLGVLYFGQWFGGRSVPSAGISVVSMAPHQRGTGVATEMMRTAVRQLADEGVPLSVLFPSTYGLYRKAGYETAGSRIGYKLNPEVLGRLRPQREMRFMRPEDREHVIAIHNERSARHNGMLDRSALEWDRILTFPPTMTVYRYVVEGRSKKRPIDGYVIYTQQSQPRSAYQILVRDWAAATPHAAKTILAWAASHTTMVDKIIFESGPRDLITLQGPEEDLSVEYRVHWMLRVLNVAAALEARGYPAGVKAEIHLQIDDDLLKHNRGKFVLTVADGRATVRKGGKGDLQLDVRAFASMYASFLSPLELELMGCVSGKADTLALATTVFSGPVPWMNDHF